MPGYAATKAALNHTTASLCQALAGTGVTVNGIAAGLIRTPEVEKWFDTEAEARGWNDNWEEIEADILRSYLPIPVGHIGVADDVARVVAFLASPNASFINGAIVRVDGAVTHGQVDEEDRKGPCRSSFTLDRQRGRALMAEDIAPPSVVLNMSNRPFGGRVDRTAVVGTRRESGRERPPTA